MWLLFPILGLIALIIALTLPAQAVWGYLVVLGWIAFVLYLVFYREDPISQALKRWKERM